MVLTWVDIVLLAITVASALLGFMRGFAKEAISLLKWIIAFIAAAQYAAQLAPFFKSYLENANARLALSFVIILLTIFLLGSLLSFLICKAIDFTGLSFLNRVAGLFFGVARALLLLAVLIVVLQSSSLNQSPAWKKSSLLPHFVPLTDWLADFVPKDMQHYFKLPVLAEKKLQKEK
jgi:membrane protein required for colicin V production